LSNQTESDTIQRNSTISHRFGTPDIVAHKTAEPNREIGGRREMEDFVKADETVAGNSQAPRNFT
jgi:hypothetical protein